MFEAQALQQEQRVQVGGTEGWERGVGKTRISHRERGWRCRRGPGALFEAKALQQEQRMQVGGNEGGQEQGKAEPGGEGNAK